MPFLMLLFLTLACLPDDWSEPLIGVATPAGSALVTWLGMGAGASAAALIAGRTRRAVTADPTRRDQVVRRYSTWRLYHLFGLFLLYGLALYVLGWGWAVQQVCMPDGPGIPATPLALASELLILSPFLAALVLSWACFYDAERALHAATPEEARSFWSRWAYVGFHVRHNLALVVIPLLLLVLQKGLHKLFPAVEQDWQVTLAFAGPLLSLAVFISLPWLLRLVLGLKPLPDGPLRTRLLATAQRLHFRFSNILLWNTRGGLANAMVAGLLPMPRYVLLTDRLIADLTPEEVEAVFGHEIGHAKHWHMLYYLAFVLLSLAVVWTGLTLLLPETIKAHDYLQVLPMVSVLGVYIFVVFGFLSRRCERQADIYGCRAVSCTRKDCLCHPEGTEMAPNGNGLCPTGIRTFIDALEKVAFLNGIPRERPGWLQSWQHSTIARRVEFLYRMLGDPSLEPRFQRSVSLVKWSLLLTLGACLALLAYVHG
jgi:Zn-dependent protease with chaperone function